MIGKIFSKDNYDEFEYANAVMWCNETQTAYIEDKGDRYEVVALPAPTLDEQKEAALLRVKTAFAEKRDMIRRVDGYGYDCTAEDITNFMAAYTPLLVQGEGTAQYKVWLTEETKGIVTLTLDDMTKVYTTVRASQIEAYAWYEDIRAQIDCARSAEEIDAILAEAGLTETSP